MIPSRDDTVQERAALSPEDLLFRSRACVLSNDFSLNVSYEDCSCTAWLSIAWELPQRPRSELRHETLDRQSYRTHSGSILSYDQQCEIFWIALSSQSAGFCCFRSAQSAADLSSEEADDSPRRVSGLSG